MVDYSLFAPVDVFDGELATLPNSPDGGAELLLLLFAPPNMDVVLGLPPPKMPWADGADPKMLAVDGAAVFAAGAGLPVLDDRLKLANDNGAGSADLLPNIPVAVGCGC